MSPGPFAGLTNAINFTVRIEAMNRQTDTTQTITFLGPVRNFGTKAGKRSYGFLLLQSGGNDPLQLEYPTKSSAIQARNALLHTDWTFSVVTMRLLYGTEKVIKTAVKHGLTHGQRQLT